MLAYGITGYEEPSIAENNYCIMRLMIDKQYQNRGYGRESMGKILGFIRTYPAGRAQYCWIPYKSENIAAKRLYESFGFRDNGEVFNNESITVLGL
jgi:diamine N-acetyltransferase